MEYKNLGNSGLKISNVSLGTWLTFGKGLDQKSAAYCMKYAFDQGINFFDNAEVYGDGIAESIMGQILKSFRRESIIVSTKIFWSGDGPNDVGLSRKHLIEATKNSLRRLQLDYIDLLFCHRPDENTPLIETVRAMDHIINQGYAFYWGTSEWSAEQIETAYTLAEKYGLIPPTMEQPQYNIFHRDKVEQDYLPLYKKYGLGITTWGPLAFGVLSGKYGCNPPQDSRLLTNPEWRPHDFDKRIKIANDLTPIAESINCTLAQLAIAWCLKNSNVSTVILGASNIDQLKENLEAKEIASKLDEITLSKIDEIVGV